MQLTTALQIVLDLAADNALDGKRQDDEALKNAAYLQAKALRRLSALHLRLCAAELDGVTLLIDPENQTGVSYAGGM